MCVGFTYITIDRKGPFLFDAVIASAEKARFSNFGVAVV